MVACFSSLPACIISCCVHRRNFIKEGGFPLVYSVWSFVLLLSHVFLEYINLTYKGLTVQAFLPIAKDTKGKINLVYMRYCKDRIWSCIIQCRIIVLNKFRSRDFCSLLPFLQRIFCGNHTFKSQKYLKKFSGVTTGKTTGRSPLKNKNSTKRSNLYHVPSGKKGNKRETTFENCFRLRGRK